MPETIGTVAEVWRYPVKSLQGEQLPEVRCGTRGMEHDRRWAARGADGALGSNKTTRLFRRMSGLLSLAASVDDDGVTWVRFPDATSARADEPGTATLVGAVVGEEVTLVEEGERSHFDDAPLHLLSTASLAWLEARRPGEVIDRRRFRPNLLLDTAGHERVEDTWLGDRLQIGEATIAVERRTARCVMTTLAQDDVPPAPGLLRYLTAESERCLGVYARVVEPGTIRVGDGVMRLGPAEP